MISKNLLRAEQNKEGLIKIFLHGLNSYALRPELL